MHCVPTNRWNESSKHNSVPIDRPLDQVSRFSSPLHSNCCWQVQVRAMGPVHNRAPAVVVVPSNFPCCAPGSSPTTHSEPPTRSVGNRSSTQLMCVATEHPFLMHHPNVRPLLLTHERFPPRNSTPPCPCSRAAGAWRGAQCGRSPFVRQCTGVPGLRTRGTRLRIRAATGGASGAVRDGVFGAAHLSSAAKGCEHPSAALLARAPPTRRVLWLGQRGNLGDQRRSTICAKGSRVGPGFGRSPGFGKSFGKSSGQVFGCANAFGFANVFSCTNVFGYSNGFC